MSAMSPTTGATHETGNSRSPFELTHMADTNRPELAPAAGQQLGRGQ